ncbi:SdiA-regulated domain-containing protein [Carboxylicivirga marina]|uniref:SdiA-regulated domain-containing protein n=1 Tax=Carboxylicivirga marina TaxID=2800988 RepID=A0ABS1HKE8_9BACT|nr:SdiA-regulated domain-containing protein [Carboxylicivirga marina]MBK3517753.1 SdiA-regulated domain-containing protein [Carboxylicivirga marina]
MNFEETIKMVKIGSKLLPLLILLCSCNGLDSQVVEFTKGGSSLYDYDKPAAVIVLNSELQEISGLDYDSANDALIAINDEKGNIYQIDKDSGESKKIYEFHKNGDYEGIAKVGKHIFVLKSNGTLYRFNTKKDKTKEFETKLSRKNDAEGLFYSQDDNSLLIACKGLPLNEKKSKKAVYRFLLDEEKLQKDPLIEINVDKLQEWAEEKELQNSLQWRIKRFSPSGIAQHPTTNNYYILSARGSMLLVISENQKLVRLVFFNAMMLPQPEGICFDRDNKLFIASEGKAGNGKLIVIKPKR